MTELQVEPVELVINSEKEYEGRTFYAGGHRLNGVLMKDEAYIRMIVTEGKGDEEKVVKRAWSMDEFAHTFLVEHGLPKAEARALVADAIAKRDKTD